MIQPTEKAEGIENILTCLTGVDRKETIKRNTCTLCGKEAREFKDQISKTEYMISGMYQKCQDKTFN